MSHIVLHGVMGRFSDGGLPAEIMVNSHHVTFWQSIEFERVLVHFLHGTGIEVTETLAEIQDLMVMAKDQL